jgi:ribonuclease BN (tRNA processing enzyme)
MAGPYFPVPFSLLEARRTMRQIGDRRESLGSFAIRAFELNHPQKAWGYRIESNGFSVVHATDFEHGNAESDRRVREAAQGADVLIYDAQFTPEQYDRHRGWGHSTWLEGTRVARDAAVKRLVLFHHHPDHCDSDVEAIVERARTEFPNVEAAREGTTIRLA